MHLRIKDQLLNDVVTQIKQWQKDSFHKSMMQIKEKKEMDDSFKRYTLSLRNIKLIAQKYWSKLLARVNKAKADYHQACKNERSAVNQERNASADTSLSPDQVTKLQDRVTKCKFEAQRAKERYEQALEEINDYNAKYMEDMTVVFDRCQEFEEKRLDFFKEMLFAIHGCLNISTDAELPQIYEEYRHSIQNADAKKDLKWWSNNHGIGMAMNWPQFEVLSLCMYFCLLLCKYFQFLFVNVLFALSQEYCEEFRDIAKLKKGAVPESGILLVNQQKIGEDLPEYTSESQNVSKKEKRGTISNDGVKLRSEKSKPSSNRNSAINLNGKQEQNPFDDDQEDWDEGSNDALVDTGEPGVPVRALYDYEGAEADELSFKNGEVFEKLEDEDEQGWCKGRKDGKVGLYPASYVEVIEK
ncbi:antigen EM13 [Caerostris extrusa]|uniref:Antigen EM13 n=1 Tax=Caerostris extrusa TaxID=172846 RepID=A0AAV4QMH3_CAEEX|nr:antigen EM13 [Caerostris extrusa]